MHIHADPFNLLYIQVFFLGYVPTGKKKRSRLKSKNDIEHKEKRKLRILNSEDEDEEYAMERKRSRESRRSDSKLSDSFVKSGKSNWYDKLENMDNNLQKALRVSES